MGVVGRVALTADDDPFVRLALKSVLDEIGFSEVIETGSLDEALEQLTQRGDVDLALFDLAMPGMKSPGSLRTVREFFETTRVVVVSSSTRREDILMALDAGVHGYIPKGLGVGELSKALRSVVADTVYVPFSITNISGEREPNISHTLSAPVEGSADILTPRQRQVLEQLVKGKSNKEIARVLNLSEGTVKVHMAALFRNIGVNSRAAAAAFGATLFP